MSTPRPGRRVRGSATGRPVMALLDLVGRRMTLRVIWELRERSLTFRALQQAADTNPSVLNARLSELRAAQLVERGPDGYALTPLGRSLLATILPLHAWAERWAEMLATPSQARASESASDQPPRRIRAERRPAASLPAGKKG
jgi:DNA-binding HxlR family transcriptional regulator